MLMTTNKSAASTITIHKGSLFPINRSIKDKRQSFRFGRLKLGSHPRRNILQHQIRRIVRRLWIIRNFKKRWRANTRLTARRALLLFSSRHHHPAIKANKNYNEHYGDCRKWEGSNVHFSECIRQYGADKYKQQHRFQDHDRKRQSGPKQPFYQRHFLTSLELAFVSIWPLPCIDKKLCCSRVFYLGCYVARIIAEFLPLRRMLALFALPVRRDPDRCGATG